MRGSFFSLGLILLVGCEIDNPNYRPGAGDFRVSDGPPVIPGVDCVGKCGEPQCATSPVCEARAITAYGILGASCADKTDRNGPLLYDRIDLAKSTCGCFCDAKCSVDLSTYGNLTCTNKNSNARLTSNGCAPVTLNQMSLALGSIPDKPTCTPPTFTIKPTTSVSTRASLCAQRNPPVCSTYSCVLEQFTSRAGLCVLPADGMCRAPFTVVTTWYKTYTDPRTCNCSCGVPTSACGGNLVLNTTVGCTGDATTKSTVSAAQTCYPFSTGFTPLTIRAIDVQMNGSCPASGTVGAGTPTLTDPVTLCCL